MAEAILLDLLLITVAALVGGLLADRLRLPTVVGYVVAGIAIGPYTAGPTISHLPLIEILAEVGLALLLFSLGLEFSLKDLALVRRIAWFGMPLLMALSAVAGVVFVIWLDWSWPALFWFGALVSLSSVLMPPRMLAGWPPAEPARYIVLGMIIVQNLLVLPLMLVLYTLGRGQGDVLHISVALVEGLVVAGVLILVGTQAIPRLVVAMGGPSPEVSNLVVLTCAVLVSLGAYWYGSPFVFAAFITGLSLSESELFAPTARAVLPFRALFGVFFFVSLGMLLDMRFWPAEVGPIILVALGMMAVKGGAIFVITRTFGYEPVTALLTGLALSQIGEMALVLVRLAEGVGVFDPAAYALSVAAVLLTLLLSPLATTAFQPLVRRWSAEAVGSP